MQRIDDVVVVRVADTSEGAHAQADPAGAEGVARGFVGPLRELHGGWEPDAGPARLPRRQREGAPPPPGKGPDETPSTAWTRSPYPHHLVPRHTQARPM